MQRSCEHNATTGAWHDPFCAGVNEALVSACDTVKGEVQAACAARGMWHHAADKTRLVTMISTVASDMFGAANIFYTDARALEFFNALTGSERGFNLWRLNLDRHLLVVGGGVLTASSRRRPASSRHERRAAQGGRQAQRYARHPRGRHPRAHQGALREVRDHQAVPRGQRPQAACRELQGRRTTTRGTAARGAEAHVPVRARGTRGRKNFIDE